MRHDWEEISLVTDKNMFADMSHYGARRCRNCKKEQTKQAEQDWGRIVRYRWEPLAGRCKGQSDK